MTITTIFEMCADVNRYASFGVKESDFPDLRVLDQGVTLASLWHQRQIIADPGPVADFAGGPLPYAKLSLNAKAVAAVMPLIESACEFVPFTYKKWSFLALHVKVPTDCVDVERIQYFTKDRLPYGMKNVVFTPEKLPKDQHIFRIPGGLVFYVTETFKRMVEEAGLTGLKFRFVWSSDGIAPPSDETVNAKPAVTTAPRIMGRRTKRVKLLERLWASIDNFGESEWWSEMMTPSPRLLASDQDALVAGPKVLAEALASGVSQENLSRLCRSIAYYAVFNALVAIEEEGLDKSAALASLHEDLLMADPKK